MVEITSSQRTAHRFTALQQARTSDGSSGSSADEVWTLIKLAFLVCCCLGSGRSGLRCGEGSNLTSAPRRRLRPGRTLVGALSVSRDVETFEFL